jgi:hypothetical protein
MVDGLHRVVITGLGAVTPIGNTVQDYWNGLTSGRNGVEAITLFDASEHAGRVAAEVKDFDPSGFIEPKEAKRWDRFCKFGVVAAKQAVAHAGLDAIPMLVRCLSTSVRYCHVPDIVCQTLGKSSNMVSLIEEVVTVGCKFFVITLSSAKVVAFTAAPDLPAWHEARYVDLSRITGSVVEYLLRNSDLPMLSTPFNKGAGLPGIVWDTADSNDLLENTKHLRSAWFGNGYFKKAYMGNRVVYDDPTSSLEDVD